MRYNGKYRILVLLLMLVVLVSCVKDPEMDCLDNNSETFGFTDGYSLNLKVTLDNFGGSATRATGDPMEELDNYIDPEKFRVLFFDKDDKFLFESKSRWVKLLSNTGKGVQWLVSVPMYPYGNDEVENWHWDDIKKELMKDKFKIAILANRPPKDWYAELKGIDLPSHWYENSGPYWGDNQSKWGDDTKTVFNLHHCQYDPMYLGKSHDNDFPTIYGAYDFIMDDWGKGTKPDDTPADVKNNKDDYKYTEPKMGATSSWVVWGRNGADYHGESIPDKYDKDFGQYYEGDFGAVARPSRLPEYTYPIPMYGIQVFNPITNWVKGTPFNLSKITDDPKDGDGYNYKSISLLRSVVKLELWISQKSFPKPPSFVALWYSNIYSRCEPMNVWDPTDEIWKDHNNGCEWLRIMEHGPICSGQTFTDAPANRKDNDIETYQKSLSWYYGAWMVPDNEGKPRWDFVGEENGFTIKDVPDYNQYYNTTGEALSYPKGPDDYPFPKIFNTCIQRNKLVICSETGDLNKYDDHDGYEFNDGYWHYVAYTGERNMIDVNKIPQMSESNAYAITWMFKDGKKDDIGSNYYFIPIADYGTKANNPNQNKNVKAREVFGPYKAGSQNTNVRKNLPNAIDSYANNIRSSIKDVDEMPWPLLRNHVYRIKIGAEPSETRAGEMNIVVESSADLHSRSLKID